MYEARMLRSSLRHRERHRPRGLALKELLGRGREVSRQRQVWAMGYRIQVGEAR
jgi:hypothetical protein